MRRHDDHQQALADVSALADGTLDPRRREEVVARIQSSPELRERYERERRVVEVLSETSAAVRAPERLRAQIESSAARRRPARARRRVAYGGAVAAVAAVVLALVLILPAGSPGSPTVVQAAELATRGVAAPAPRPDRHASGARLADGVDDVYFPNWSRGFGWHAIGRRTDHLGDRLARTVFYAGHRRLLAYTIVDAPALALPGGPSARVHGTTFRTLRVDHRTVVTWRRENHTCVLSGRGVSAAMLRRLAAWGVPA